MQDIILFATGLAALQVVPIIAQESEEKEHLHFDEAFLIPMFMMLTPLAVMATMALAITTSHLILKKEWYKTLFNVTQMSLAAGAGALVGRSLTAAVLGAMLYSVITGAAVFGLFKYLNAEWQGNYPFRVIVLGSSLILGITMATRLDFASIAATATVASQLGYQAYVTRPELATVNV